MTILFAYDGSKSADAAIAAAARLVGREAATAIVLTIWEPVTVEALRAARFGGWPRPSHPTSPRSTSAPQHKPSNSPSTALA
jgi:Universal stress protein family